MKTVSRREFLKTGIGLAAVISSPAILAGPAASNEPAAAASMYAPLPHKKVQPPREGCFVGFFKEPEAPIRQKDSQFMPLRSLEVEAAKKARSFDEYVEILNKERSSGKTAGYDITNEIIFIERAINARPFIFSMVWSTLYWFPMTSAMAIAKKGIVPFVYGKLGSSDTRVPVPGFGPKEIAQSKHDGLIRKFAQGAEALGKAYGGFFFTTMHEMNGNWFSWGMNPNCVPAWKRIWQIFEDEGANHYATWVWEVYPHSILPPSMVDNPERYYPGDRYVDWIGINAFSVAGGRYSYGPFDSLIDNTYGQLLKDHPQKPFMISSFGSTNEPDQSKWLVDAYGKIKSGFPAIKAIIYLDNSWKLTGDHTLNQKGWEALKEIFKDPYWIMAGK